MELMRARLGLVLPVVDNIDKKPPASSNPSWGLFSFTDKNVLGKDGDTGVNFIPNVAMKKFGRESK